MSWALEEWKEGLPTRALQKIEELEGQLDKLKKGRQQAQFQLETLEAALQKQKQKVPLKRWLSTVHSACGLFDLGLQFREKCMCSLWVVICPSPSSPASAPHFGLPANIEGC